MVSRTDTWRRVSRFRFGWSGAHTSWRRLAMTDSTNGSRSWTCADRSRRVSTSDLAGLRAGRLNVATLSTIMRTIQDNVAADRACRLSWRELSVGSRRRKDHVDDHSIDLSNIGAILAIQQIKNFYMIVVPR
jgi:hypothetical protein